MQIYLTQVQSNIQLYVGNICWECKIKIFIGSKLSVYSRLIGLCKFSVVSLNNRKHPSVYGHYLKYFTKISANENNHGIVDAIHLQFTTTCCGNIIVLMFITRCDVLYSPQGELYPKAQTIAMGGTSGFECFHQGHRMNV